MCRKARFGDPNRAGFVANLAAEAAAQLAQQLPNGVAAGVAAVVTREEEHRANLLFIWHRKRVFRGCLDFVSRGHKDHTPWAANNQAVSFSSKASPFIFVSSRTQSYKGARITIAIFLQACVHPHDLSFKDTGYR